MKTETHEKLKILAKRSTLTHTHTSNIAHRWSLSVMNSALLLLSICFLSVLSVGDGNRFIKIIHTASKVIVLQPDLITEAVNRKSPTAQIIHSTGVPDNSPVFLEGPKLKPSSCYNFRNNKKKKISPEVLRSEGLCIVLCGISHCSVCQNPLQLNNSLNAEQVNIIHWRTSPPDELCKNYFNVHRSRQFEHSPKGWQLPPVNNIKGCDHTYSCFPVVQTRWSVLCCSWCIN